MTLYRFFTPVAQRRVVSKPVILRVERDNLTGQEFAREQFRELAHKYNVDYGFIRELFNHNIKLSVPAFVWALELRRKGIWPRYIHRLLMQACSIPIWLLRQTAGCIVPLPSVVANEDRVQLFIKFLVLAKISLENPAIVLPEDMPPIR